MRQTVGQRRHLKLKNHQNISSVCPWCVELAPCFCLSNFSDSSMYTRRARSASTSPSEPGGMDEMDKMDEMMKSDMSLYDSPHALHLEDIIRSIVCSYYSSIGHIGSYRISSDQTTDFLSIDVPIIFESFIEILRSQKKKQRAALMISNAGNIRFGSRCSSWGNTSGFRASQGDENDPRW